MVDITKSPDSHLEELQEHLATIMDHAFVTKQSADEVCKVISEMLHSFQYGRIKQEMDSQELRRNSE